MRSIDVPVLLKTYFLASKYYDRNRNDFGTGIGYKKYISIPEIKNVSNIVFETF